MNSSRRIYFLLRYLSSVLPPNEWGTRSFLGGSGRRTGAHMHPAFPKMPTAASAFPLLGALQAPDNKPKYPKWVKAWWEGTLRPKENSSCRYTLGHIHAAVKFYPATGEVQYCNTAQSISYCDNLFAKCVRGVLIYGKNWFHFQRPWFEQRKTLTINHESFHI